MGTSEYCGGIGSVGPNPIPTRPAQQILITGGSGQVGAYVIDRLKARHKLSVLDRIPPVHYPDLPFLKVDLTSLREVNQAVKGFDVVVHLAAIPHPFNDPGDRVLSVNVTSTYNIMEAARLNGIRRVIYACSESASGFGIHAYPCKPDYIPIDEEHPSRPHESYGLSKYCAEIICQEYSRAYGIESISLRYAWVWLDACREEIEKILARQMAEEWFAAYIFPEDVAQAIECSLSMQLPDRHFPFEMFYLTAQDTFSALPSLDLINKLFQGDRPKIRKPAYFEENPHASLFDITKAKKMLGYNPEFGWKDFYSRKRRKPDVFKK